MARPAPRTRRRSRCPTSSGARAEIRALARTADPSVITIGAGARIVAQMAEDQLQILEFLPLENTSDRMFDPAPGALEIPLPTGFTGAQPQENERKIDVRQDHGVAVHGADRPQALAARRGRRTKRQANEVVFGFVLPYRGDSYDFSQPMPNGLGPATLITDRRSWASRVERPGRRARARNACWAGTSTG